MLDLSKNAITECYWRLQFPENIQKIDLTENPLKYFTLRQKVRDLADQAILLIDDFQLHDSVLNALKN